LDGSTAETAFKKIAFAILLISSKEKESKVNPSSLTT